MQTPLTQNSSFIQVPSNQSTTVTEEKIIQPLTQILEEVPPKLPDQQTQAKNNSQIIKHSLDELFPEQQYDEKNIKKAKEILGDLENEFTDIQLRSIVAEIQYLAESWLDNYEREIFDGLTLKELLHEKGGS